MFNQYFKPIDLGSVVSWQLKNNDTCNMILGKQKLQARGHTNLGNVILEEMQYRGDDPKGNDPWGN